jgi:RNA polymerase sigma factor (sigma-70 family)
MAIETLGAALRQINRLFADGVVAGLSDAQLLERFLDDGDAESFEVLLGRHGPMVLSVCRGILRDPHDAEDAFQATFLVLVKTGGTIRGGEALGGWLHRVAHRVANQANVAAARRRRHERQVGQMAVATSTNGPAASDDWLPALHEEIARLPEKYRLAIVHCDLEGLTQVQAAGQLHWSERTLRHRLAEGRARLGRRLARRGLAPNGAALGAVFSREARAAVPAAWSEATVRAAVAVVNPTMTVGAVSLAAQQLAQEVFKVMLLQKLILASLTLLAAGLIAWGASAALVSLEDGPSQKSAAGPSPSMQRKAEAAVPQPGPTPSETPGKVPVGGRVLGPDGRPIAGAKIYRAPAFGDTFFWHSDPSHESATTGPDGRFQFLTSRWAEFTNENQKLRLERTVVAAAAVGYGLAWVEVPPGGRSDDLTLQLVEDRPITGQVVDLEGKPVPGATLQVLEIRAAAGEDLGPWLEAARARKGRSYRLEQKYLPRSTITPASKLTADAEGRFRLTGIGRDRLVVARLDGPTIASQKLSILTRPGEALTVVPFRFPAEGTTTYYGADFRHAAAPTRPIAGVVRDKDTKKPLAGIVIMSDRLADHPLDGYQMVQTTSDAQGHYLLSGMPKGEGNRIKVVPGNDQPYIISFKDVPDSPGLDTVTADVELKRGIWIEGRLTDKVTGQPVVGPVRFYPQAGNPNIEAYGYTPGASSHAAADEDGFYRLAGMPGPGLVAVPFPLGPVGVRFVDGYLRAHERNDEFGVKEIYLPTISVPTMNYSAIARIDPATSARSVKRDLTLDPGWTFKGRVLGPDGRPLAGAWGIGLTARMIFLDRDFEVLKTAEFTVSSYNPHRPRPLLFQHPEKGLVGVAQPPKNEGDSIIVQLRPGATVEGRLVDPNGRARPGVELGIYRRYKEPAQPDAVKYFPTRSKTDQQGRFRIKGLLPEQEFTLYDEKGERRLGEGLRSGETKDLGDVTIGNE